MFLAALLLAGQRALLHVAAAVALGLAACSVWIMRESVFLGVMGLLYAGLWSAWYWHTAWTQAAGKPPIRLP